MTFDQENSLQSILESLDRIENIRLEDIPNIDLYMDQLTTFMDDHLKKTTRNPQEDKVLTKTMINNYAKNDLLPPPIRKKYSKDHVILLIFIYYFKNVMSINDIQTLLSPIKEKFHVSDTDGVTLGDIYQTALEIDNAEVEALKADLIRKHEIASETFTDAGEDREKLQLFSFIALLSYDVYVKKLIVEKLLDGFRMQQEAEQRENEAQKKQGKEKTKKEKKS